MLAVSLIIYNLFVRLYYTVAVIAAWFSPKAKDWVNGRQVTLRLLQNYATPKAANRVWFHCSSLGEFEQARPVIEQLKAAMPETFIVLTFFSPSGYNIRYKYTLADVVCYLPLDTQANAARFIESFQPTLVLWTKYDFYYHLLHELHKRSIPLVLFSARFNANQIFFKGYGELFKKMLSFYSSIFVQDNHSQELLNKIGIVSVVANDTRFDRVIAIAQERKPFAAIEHLTAGRKVIVCGSTWQQDEQLLLPLINASNNKEVFWIVAPHNINVLRIESFAKQLNSKALLFSQINDNASADVLIIDNIGMLSSLYAYADIAYVGGGFGVSVHNVLEAAVYGVPVVFGTNYFKSIECIELIAAGGAFSVSSQQQLQQKIIYLLNTDNAVKSGEIARNYVYQRQGGTDKILTFVSKHLK